MQHQIKTGIGGHQSAIMGTDEWLTPPEIIKSLGEFDLDPCTPINRPWDTAKHHYNVLDNGLQKPWFGRVWMNPVYGRECINWLRRLADHGNGITIVFARTETKMFFECVWPKAESIFFFSGRLHFYKPNGQQCGNAGGPNCLISYGEENAEAIDRSGLKGHHVPLQYVPMIIVGVSPSWKSVVRIVINRLNGTGSLQQIYDMVEQVAPDKIQKNSFYKEKIRQTLQMFFDRKDKGVYSITTEN